MTRTALELPAGGTAPHEPEGWPMPVTVARVIVALAVGFMVSFPGRTLTTAKPEEPR